MVRKSDLPRRAGAIWDALAQGDPDALAEAHAMTTRKAAMPVQHEREEVQRPLIVYLRRHLEPGSVVFSVPNMARSRQQTFTLIRDGMLPGVPDVCVLTTRSKQVCGDDDWIEHVTPWVGFIECKRPGGGSLS